MKIDFLDRSDQWMVNFYRKAAKNAAEHHLMLDFHGAFKPDGMRRTYPNVLTREGVMGAEYNTLERASYAPAQRDAGLHPHAGGAHGLHARRVR